MAVAPVSLQLSVNASWKSWRLDRKRSLRWPPTSLPVGAENKQARKNRKGSPQRRILRRQRQSLLEGRTARPKCRQQEHPPSCASASSATDRSTPLTKTEMTSAMQPEKRQSEYFERVPSHGPPIRLCPSKDPITSRPAHHCRDLCHPLACCGAVFDHGNVRNFSARFNG